jgi:ABC-type transport system substrate-binding protein
MWRNKKWLLAFSLLTVGAFALAACAGEPAADDERVADLEAQLAAAQADASTSEEELAALADELAMAEEEAAAAAVTVGGECCEVYRIGIFEDPLTTNFWNYLGPGSSVWTQYIIGDTAGTLYTLSDQRFDFVPSLAADLPPEPVQEGDFFTITVPMREDIVWSDGTPITANDVVFTMQTCLELQLTSNWPNQCRPEIMDHVEAVNDTTVKFYFNELPGLAQWQFGAAQGAILPEHFWTGTVAESYALIEGVTEPEAARPEDCEAEGLSAEDAAACESWAAYDTAFNDARTTLYQADASGTPVSGGYETTKFEPGAFVERNANASTVFAGSKIEEYDDGTWVLTLTNGDVVQLYGDAGGEKTLEFVSGPYSDNVVFSIYGSQDAAFLAMADGEIDYVMNPLSLARGLREQAEQGEGIVTHTNSDNGLFYLAFNMRKEPYGRPEFTQAVDIVIDKEFVAGSVLQGTVTPTYSVVPPGNAFWYSDVETPYVGMSREDRVNLAIQVLEDAGWSWDTKPAWNEDRVDVDPGTGLRMPNGELMPDTTILGPGPAYDPQRATFNQWISEWMRELGMPVTSELTGFNTILNPVFVDSDFDLYILGWSLTLYPDYIVDFFHSRNDTAVSGNFNTPGFNNAEFDAAGDAFLAETDITRAQEQAAVMQQLVANGRPYIPLFVRQSIDLIRNNVFLPYTDTLGGITEVLGFQTDAQVLSK